MVHVAVEPEVLVIDPQRPAAIERPGRNSLAVARHEVQPSLDEGDELVERRRGPLADRERADVHLRVRAVLVQEQGVEGAETVGVAPRHGGQG
jgi:hypothetical protein